MARCPHWDRFSSPELNTIDLTGGPLGCGRRVERRLGQLHAPDSTKSAGGSGRAKQLAAVEHTQQSVRCAFVKRGELLLYPFA
jgi:hypothetical protein